MAEFQTDGVAGGLVEGGLPPVVEHHFICRIFESGGFDPEAVVWRENGHLTSCAAVELHGVIHRKGCPVVRDHGDADGAEVEHTGIFHQEGCVAYGVVDTASRGSQYI